MNELIKNFYSEEIKGECTDPNFEFGNLHRKEYKCSFCDDNMKCHYKENCNRRDISGQNLGWRIN